MEGNASVSRFKAYLIPIIIAIVMGAILFLPAGSLLYWEAWIYWFGIFAITMFVATYFIKRDPKFLAKRSQFREKSRKKLSCASYHSCTWQVI
jgi:phosphoglycerol transferase MdoB-like AlkP superfamily enzyme